jgi:hypothetical protein
LVGKGTLVDVLVGKGTLVDVLVLNWQLKLPWCNFDVGRVRQLRVQI